MIEVFLTVSKEVARSPCSVACMNQYLGERRLEEYIYTYIHF